MNIFEVFDVQVEFRYLVGLMMERQMECCWY